MVRSIIGQKVYMSSWRLRTYFLIRLVSGKIDIAWHGMAWHDMACYGRVCAHSPAGNKVRISLEPRGASTKDEEKSEAGERERRREKKSQRERDM